MSRLCQLPDAVILILSTLVFAYTWKYRLIWGRIELGQWLHIAIGCTSGKYRQFEVEVRSSLYVVGKILAGLSILFGAHRRNAIFDSTRFNRKKQAWWIQKVAVSWKDSLLFTQLRAKAQRRYDEWRLELILLEPHHCCLESVSDNRGPKLWADLITAILRAARWWAWGMAIEG
jgi:hypothetical protein